MTDDFVEGRTRLRAMADDYRHRIRRIIRPLADLAERQFDRDIRRTAGFVIGQLRANNAPPFEVWAVMAATLEIEESRRYVA